MKAVRPRGKVPARLLEPHTFSPAEETSTKFPRHRLHVDRRLFSARRPPSPCIPPGPPMAPPVVRNTPPGRACGAAAPWLLRSSRRRPVCCGVFFFFSTSVKFVVSLPEERVFSFLNVVHSLCRRRVAPLCLLRGVLLGGPAFNRVKREKRCCCFEMPRRE